MRTFRHDSGRHASHSGPDSTPHDRSDTHRAEPSRLAYEVSRVVWSPNLDHRPVVGVGTSPVGQARMLSVPTDTVHPLAAAMARPETRFRLPEFADLRAIYANKTLKMPELVIQDRVRQLLDRMERDKRLKTKDSVPTILAKIFPAPGVIVEAEFNAAIDAADRTRIYKSVLDAHTTVKPADQPKLKTAIGDAIDLVKQAEGNTVGLTAVFGSKHNQAKQVYAKSRAALRDVAKDMAKHITTDYNLDDPEVGLGGWANFSSRHMHLLLDVVQGADQNETKATLIHEAAHLADHSVNDRGYYGTPNFEALPEDVKVANAAHYEELPRRSTNTSAYMGVTFTPGVNKAGGAVTWQDEIRRSASEYTRKAWDAAVDTFTFIRGVHVSALAGDRKPFTNNRALILEISKIMDLTIHFQDPANAEVTTLDVTLGESIAHAVSEISSLAMGVAVVKPGGLFMSQADEDRAARDLVVADAANKHGRLRGSGARDKALLDWLVAHFKSLP